MAELRCTNDRFGNEKRKEAVIGRKEDSGSTGRLEGCKAEEDDARYDIWKK